jgi:hypothetical protein
MKCFTLAFVLGSGALTLVTPRTAGADVPETRIVYPTPRGPLSVEASAPIRKSPAELRAERRSASHLRTAGIVLTSISVPFLPLGIFTTVALRETTLLPGIGILAFGSIFALAGIPMIVNGVRGVREADAAIPRVSLGPGGGSLTWSF